MEISVQQADNNVTILALDGELDGSNYQDVIAKAQEVIEGGAENLLIDMSGVSFMGSAGLVALHSIALLMRGEELPDPEAGWAALHAIANLDEKQPHVKISSPQPSVMRGLEKTGMSDFFEIHTDQQAAVSSFG